MPDVTGAAREQLLLHQFLAGLPVSISKQLWTAGDVTRVETALEQTRLLMALEVELERNRVWSPRFQSNINKCENLNNR